MLLKKMFFLALMFVSIISFADGEGVGVRGGGEEDSVSIGERITCSTSIQGEESKIYACDKSKCYITEFCNSKGWTRD